MTMINCAHHDQLFPFEYDTLAPCPHATFVAAQVRQPIQSQLPASPAAGSTSAKRTWKKLRPVHTRMWSIRKNRNWSCGRRSHNNKIGTPR